ncbi:hypothetical protein BDV59DRAFT_203354 [Aspergillus ambiguus]|uniref:DUF1748 domain-containing protein n=1 Tax=Aspergillus ambiguus TaxID=176160 RepID=UPI003CCCEF88
MVCLLPIARRSTWIPTNGWLPAQLGRLGHYAFDAVLISAFLAGVKRSTGLTLNSDKITDNKDFKKWIDSYLGVGEWVMDQSVAVLGSSSYFERKR